MALDHKQLIKIQVPAVIGSLGAPAADKKWYLKQITLFNTGATPETVKLYLQATTAASQIEEYTLDALERYTIPLEYPWVLEATEPLYGVTDTATTVNVFVTGAETDA